VKSERHQFGLGLFRGRRNRIAVLEGDVGVAALVLVVSTDVGPFVGVMERYHVIANLAFELADWDSLPTLGIAEKVVDGEKF
jgi:hypothetical protein